MSFRIYLYHPVNVNNDAEVLSIFTNPITSDITATFGGLVVDGTIEIIGEVSIIGQIENKYSTTNNSVVIGYDPVDLKSTSTDNVILGDAAWGAASAVNGTGCVVIGSACREDSIGDNNSVFAGVSVMQLNTNSVAGSCMVGANILANNETSVASSSVMMGTDILLNATAGSFSDTMLAGSSILKNATSVGNMTGSVLVGNRIMSSITNTNGLDVGSNTMVGSNILTNKNYSSGSLSMNFNVLVGTECGGNNSLNSLSSYTVFRANTVLGYQALHSNGVAGNITGALNNTIVGSLAGSQNDTTLIYDSCAFGGGALNTCTNVNAMSGCVFIGAGSKTTNSVSAIAEQRSAIGMNALVTRDYSMVLGQTGTAGTRGISVGIGTTAPSALLHLRQGGNALDATNALYVETSNQTGVIAVNATGMSCTGQFALNYYTNNSVVVGKTRNPNTSYIGGANVIVGDGIYTTALTGTSVLTQNTLIGTNILHNLTNIAAGNHDINVIIGNNVMSSVTKLIGAGAMLFDSNTFIGSAIFEGVNVATGTFNGNFRRNTVLGVSACGSNSTVLEEFQNNTIMGALSVNGNPNLTGMGGVTTLGRQTFGGNTSLANLQSSIAIGYLAGSSMTNVTGTMTGCVAVGNSATFTNAALGTALNRMVLGTNAVSRADYSSAIGANAIVATPNAMVLGQTGTGSAATTKGTMVGIGTISPTGGLLHIRQSSNSTDTTTLLHSETPNASGIFAITPNGFQVYNLSGTTQFSATVSYERQVTNNQTYVIPDSMALTLKPGNASDILVSPNVDAGTVTPDWNPNGVGSYTLTPSRSGFIRINLSADLPAGNTSGVFTFTNTAIKPGCGIMITPSNNTSHVLMMMLSGPANGITNTFAIQLQNPVGVAQGSGQQLALYYLVI